MGTYLPEIFLSKLLGWLVSSQKFPKNIFGNYPSTILLEISPTNSPYQNFLVYIPYIFSLNLVGGISKEYFRDYPPKNVWRYICYVSFVCFVQGNIFRGANLQESLWNMSTKNVLTKLDAGYPESPKPVEHVHQKCSNDTRRRISRKPSKMLVKINIGVVAMLA